MNTENTGGHVSPASMTVRVSGKLYAVRVPDRGRNWSQQELEAFAREQYPSIGGGAGSKDEQAIEQEIQRKGLNAPRLTPDLIDAQIIAEEYHVFSGTTLTVCCLVLQNGFCVTGESAAADPANFDETIGRKIARQNAREKIWPLEGYRLRQHLYETQVSGAA